jgi:hypothetical protein
MRRARTGHLEQDEKVHRKKRGKKLLQRPCCSQETCDWAERPKPTERGLAEPGRDGRRINARSVAPRGENEQVAEEQELA